MIDNWDNPDDDDDLDEESTQDVDWNGKDAVIFLIDATKSMFRHEDSFFRKALTCCHMTMLKKVMGSAKDLIAVVLFGTAKKENHLNLNHVYVLQTLEQPNIEKIKGLDRMIQSDNFDYFEDRYGHSDDYILQDALWLCQSIFANCEQKIGMQRILLFTANDDPHSGNQLEQQRALDRAQDLHGLDISLELLHMGSSFNVNIFYKDLIEAAMGEDYAEQALARVSEHMEELLLRVCRYSHKMRSQGRHLFYLGPKLAIGVGIYSMLRKGHMPKKIWLERSSNLIVKPTTHHFNTVTGEVVLPMDVIKCYEYGGQKIALNSEKNRITGNILEPGFYLMGFKQKEKIKIEYHYSKPYFIFPDERQVIGSRKLFAALLKRCVQRDKVMICWGALRQGALPQLFAFIPQQEELNSETGGQEIAGGFHAFALPLSENIQPLEVENMMEPNESQLDLMRKVVSKLTFCYNVHAFQNPMLQRLWAGIEALALEMPSPRETEDNTKPNYEEISRKLGALALEFNETFYLKGRFTADKKVTRAAAKREGGSKTTTNGSRAIKQPKTEEIDMEEMAKQGKVGNLKVDQLKAFLVARGKKVSGKRKADLVNMVYSEMDMDVP